MLLNFLREARTQVQGKKIHILKGIYIGESIFKDRFCILAGLPSLPTQLS